jgi:hypothetical protein
MSNVTEKEKGRDGGIHHKVTLSGSVTPKGTLEMKQELRWEDKSWTISGIILTLLATIFFGLCSLNGLSLGINVLISVGLVIGLFLIIWAMRRFILILLRRLDRAFKITMIWRSK